MKEDLKHKLFNSTDCISEKTMFDYIDNKLSPKEQHFVEKHMLDCELCSDAMDGLRMLKDREKIKTLHQLIEERISENKTKIFRINYRTIISIAAGILLLTGGIFFFRYSSDSLMEKKKISELKVSEKTVSNEPTTSMPDSADLLSGKEVNSDKTQNKKSNKTISLKEADRQPGNEISSNNGGAGSSIASGEDIISQKSITSEEDLINAPETKNNLEMAPSPEKSVSNNYKADESKDKAAEVVNEEQNNEGYQEQTENNSAKKNPELKSESKKKEKENKREESTSISETSPSAAYAPVEIQQKNAGVIEKTKTNSDAGFYSARNDSTETIKETDETFTIVQEMAEYPGGVREMNKFIKHHFNFENLSPDDQVSKIKITVQFVVDKNGIIKNLKIVKSMNPQIDKEVIRVIKLMPPWSPGKQNGKKVTSIYTLPIELDLK